MGFRTLKPMLKNKKIAELILIAVLSLSLVACGTAKDAAPIDPKEEALNELMNSVEELAKQKAELRDLERLEELWIRYPKIITHRKSQLNSIEREAKKEMDEIYKRNPRFKDL